MQPAFDESEPKPVEIFERATEPATVNENAKRSNSPEHN
jgi:hypothetical protein